MYLHVKALKHMWYVRTIIAVHYCKCICTCAHTPCHSAPSTLVHVHVLRPDTYTVVCTHYMYIPLEHPTHTLHPLWTVFYIACACIVILISHVFTIILINKLCCFVFETHRTTHSQKLRRFDAYRLKSKA